MPTTAELRVMDTPQIANAILIHGINLVFVDHADLVGFNFGGSRTGQLGLSRVGLQYRHSVNMRKASFDDNPVDFTIQDFDGSLARLFGAIDDSERSLGDVPIGAGLPLPASGTAPSDLFGLNVGTERIGPAGERALYPSPSGFSVGTKHTIAVPGLDLAGAPVSENPIVWAGRRITLYRLYRDHVTYPSRTAGTVSWRPFSEAYLQWTGVLRDEGTVRNREWTLSADGIEGYLRKALGVGFQANPVRAVADVPPLSTIDGASEVGIACKLNVIYDGGSPNLDFGEREFVADITATTVDGIRAEIIAEIDAAAAAVGGSGTWNDQPGYSVGMLDDSSVRIGVDDQTGTPVPPGDGCGKLSLCLHRKVWALLGYDLELQMSLESSPDEPRAIMFAEVNDINGTWASTKPGSDYWTGTFLTGRSESAGWPRGLDNDGLHRIYTPQYTGGTSVLLVDPGVPGQVVRLADANLGLGDAASTVAHPGQHSRPVADYTIPGSGGPCDRQGFWLAFGKRRMQGTDEVVDEVRLVVASWRNGAGQNDGLVEGDTILVTDIMSGSRVGFPTKTPDTNWITLATAMDADEGMLQFVPICVLAYREKGYLDHAHIVAQRLLYSTGTGDGWTGFLDDPDATLDAGDNEPTGTHTIVRDAEVAELGLSIPAALIHPPSVWQAERNKIENDDILDVKIAFIGGYQAMDALRSCLQPIGWSFHLRGGRIGVWCPADSVTQEDVDVVLDRSVKASEYGAARRVLVQDLRKWGPIDKWTFDYDWAPMKNAAQRKLEMPSPDAGFRYRPGEVHQVVTAHGMRFPPKGVAERVSKLSKWWSRRHFEVKGWPVPAIDPGEDLWPGTIIRITDPDLVDALGEYGVTGRLGVVTGCTTTMGLDSVEKTVDLLIFADTDATPRVHAPSAFVTAYDSVTRTLTCSANWLGIGTAGDTWYDAPKFSEPNYTGITQFGGAMAVQVYQWDGTSYTVTLSGRVASTTNTTIVLSATGLTGTFLRDQDAIVVAAPSASQVSDATWPTQILSPVCQEDGTFTNAAAATVDGYPWEP